MERLSFERCQSRLRTLTRLSVHQKRDNVVCSSMVQEKLITVCTLNHLTKSTKVEEKAIASVKTNKQLFQGCYTCPNQDVLGGIAASSFPVSTNSLFLRRLLFFD